MPSGLGFQLGRLRATGRIAFDYLNSVLRPICRDPEPWPAAATVTRAGESADVLPERFRLLSWNIHRAYRVRDVERSLEGILGGPEPPGVMILQEVPVFPDGAFWERGGARELLAPWHVCFAPMHSVDVPSPYYPFVASGQLTASRTPLVAWQVSPLPTVSRPKLGRRHHVQRLALETRIRTRAGEVGVWNVHLENTARPGGRGRQVRSLLDHIACRQSAPTVVGGDFNTLLGGLEDALRALATVGFRPVEVVGRRRRRPALDHVFVRGLGPLWGRELAVAGSDHRPLLVEVELATPHP